MKTFLRQKFGISIIFKADLIRWRKNEVIQKLCLKILKKLSY